VVERDSVETVDILVKGQKRVASRTQTWPKHLSNRAENGYWGLCGSVALADEELGVFEYFSSRVMGSLRDRRIPLVDTLLGSSTPEKAAVQAVGTAARGELCGRDRALLGWSMLARSAASAVDTVARGAPCDRDRGRLPSKPVEAEK
jgi:hypothetical protein